MSSSSTTLDRLRELVRTSGRGRSTSGAPAPASPVAVPVPPPPSPSALADHGAGLHSSIRELIYEQVDPSGLPMPARYDLPALPGANFCDTPLGRCVVIDHTFDAESLHGRLRVEQACVTTADVLGFCEAQAAPALSIPPGDADLDDDLAALEDEGPVMFLDLETTGLSGGAGTVAFLVGCGFFEQGAFRTQQFLLPGFASERALLHAVTACLGRAGCLVTYNGRTFDLPVMETRWLFHRQPVPWTELTHLDMLHVSRRLWRARGEDAEASCRLVFLERDLFGVERVGDVSGWEIPGRYFDYIRHGDARVLDPVLHHNRLDLLSLALLTARAVRLLRDGLEATVDPVEWLALGRELARINRCDRAEACFRAVAECRTATDVVRAEALYAWARLLRRGRRHRDAAAVWKQLVGCRSARAVLRAEAQQALAVHYEHRDRDLDVAHQWAEGAYAIDLSPRHREAVEYRLARLRRKMAVRTKGGPETAFQLSWLAFD